MFKPTPGRIYAYQADNHEYWWTIQEGVGRWRPWEHDRQAWGVPEDNPTENVINDKYRDVTLEWIFQGKYEHWS